MPERPSISSESIRDLKGRIDLREIAAQFTTLSGQGERIGPCPRCGGEDRFHVQPHMFFCRQCYPAEQQQGRHDIYDFVRFMGLAHNFREAYQLVAGWANTAPSSVRQTQSPEQRISYRTDAWQQAAQAELDRTHQLLLSSQGEVGRVYLAQRKFQRETWMAARLGLASRLDTEGQYGWAIALPWVYEDRVTTIQYRFIEPRAQRYMRFSHQRNYGETLLFTLPPKSSETLVVVEGEFNALSVWQETRYDAISFGSQNMTSQTLEALQNAVGAYERVMVWADQPQVAHDLITTFGRPGEVVTSELDANEQLMRGELKRVLP